MPVFVFLVLLQLWIKSLRLVGHSAIDKEPEISLLFTNLKRVKITLNSIVLNSIAFRR